MRVSADDETATAGQCRGAQGEDVERSMSSALALPAPTLALTLRQPWPWAMLVDEVPIDGVEAGCLRPAVKPKRIENRTRRPPVKLLGQRFAIHAGLTPDLDAFAELRRDGILAPEPEEMPFGCVVGVATLDTWHATPPSMWEMHPTVSQFYWWRGPYAWILTDVVPLVRPVPCRGLVQHGWEMPEDVVVEVADQLHFQGLAEKMDAIAGQEEARDGAFQVAEMRAVAAKWRTAEA